MNIAPRYCTRCGHVGRPRIHKERRFGPVFWILLLLGGIPALIYFVFGGGVTKSLQCASCAGTECTIPFGSPIAQVALSSLNSPVALTSITPQPASKSCSKCGTVLSAGGRFCVACGHAQSDRALSA